MWMSIRYEMISRARKNRGYARSWGIDVLKEEEMVTCQEINN